MRPGLDDKRLTAWNALMISALADAGAVLGARGLPRRRARVPPSSCCATCATPTAACCAPTTAGARSLNAYLEDHAFLLEALLTLYEATFEPRWFVEARALADTIIERFADPERGGFFSTADDHEPLVARRKELEDAPIPSGGVGGGVRAAAARAADRRGALRGGGGRRTIRLLHTIAPQHPAAFGHLLQAIDFHLADVREVALVGDDREPLERVVREAFRPHLVLAGGDRTAGCRCSRAASRSTGRAAAYVCERFACRRPVDRARASCARCWQTDPPVQAAHAPRAARSRSSSSSRSRPARGPRSGPLSGKFEDAQENEATSFLPGDAESVKALKAIERFPDGEARAAVTVIARDGGADAGRPRPGAQLVESLNDDPPPITAGTAGADPVRGRRGGAGRHPGAGHRRQRRRVPGLGRRTSASARTRCAAAGCRWR